MAVLYHLVRRFKDGCELSQRLLCLLTVAAEELIKNLWANGGGIVLKDDLAGFAIDLISPEVPFRMAISIQLFELALAKAGDELIGKSQA